MSHWRFVLLIGLTVSAIPALAANGLAPIHQQGGARVRSVPLDPLASPPYHNAETLICSDCHVSHFSQSHGPQPDGTGAFTPLGPAGPYKKLLRNDALDLCLSCHDNRVGIPDVLGADVNGLAERSGGFFDVADVSNPRGHDLGHGLEPLWSSTGCFRCHFDPPTPPMVTCTDCHDPHGNGNPRNLQWASYPEGTPPLGLLNPDGVTGLGKYERQNVGYGTLNSSALREVTNICLDCHHVFTGGYYNDPNGDNLHEKHPSYDSERGDPNDIEQGAGRGSTDPIHWEGGTGSGFDGTERVPFVTSGASDYAGSRVVDAGTNGVLCLSCHKAHGSGHAFGLVWDLNGTVDRKGCDQCHAVKPLP